MEEEKPNNSCGWYSCIVLLIQEGKCNLTFLISFCSQTKREATKNRKMKSSLEVNLRYAPLNRGGLKFLQQVLRTLEIRVGACLLKQLSFTICVLQWQFVYQNNSRRLTNESVWQVAEIDTTDLLWVWPHESENSTLSWKPYSSCPKWDC